MDETRSKSLVVCIEDVNIKGIQKFEFQMMVHVIHTQTKIDLRNMHTNLYLCVRMLFNILILPIHTFELNIIWFQNFEFKVEHNLV